MEAVRPARIGDLPAIVDLVRAMHVELDPMRGGRIWSVREARPEPLEDSYRALLTDEGQLHRIVLGTFDGAVVGFGVGEIELLAVPGFSEKNAEEPERLGRVTDLFVEPEARAVGVGEAILNDLLDFFRAQGCRGVDALALPGHRTTKNFFEEQGFTARQLIMHHQFPDKTN